MLPQLEVAPSGEWLRR